jgi:hypothetical protein
VSQQTLESGVTTTSKIGDSARFRPCLEVEADDVSHGPCSLADGTSRRATAMIAAGASDGKVWNQSVELARPGDG